MIGLGITGIQAQSALKCFLCLTPLPVRNHAEAKSGLRFRQPLVQPKGLVGIRACIRKSLLLCRRLMECDQAVGIRKASVSGGGLRVVIDRFLEIPYAAI